MEERLLEATVRLTAAAESLAALAAHLRVVTEGVEVDPEIGALLASIAAQVVGDAPLDPSEPAAQSIGMTRALLAEALSLVDNPARVGDWSATDPAVLQGLGRISMSIAPVIAAAATRLEGLDQRLQAPGAAVLDVGTGTGWLALALAATFPAARVVGIDLFEPALAFARTNVASHPAGHRVEIRAGDVRDLDDTDTYDAVWLPLPFLPREVVVEAARRAFRALRPGGWVLPGTFAGPDNPLGQLLTELRIRRSGGYPWSADALHRVLGAAGFDDAVELARTWAAPVRLHAARRPTP